MSAKLFKKDVLFLQRLLSSARLYRGPLDGRWNTELDDADAAFDRQYQSIKAELGEFDKRSEDCIVTLLPKAQRAARQFMRAVPASGLTYRIISATRTYAEQDALFEIGRTIEMNRRPVTNARGGQSNHNFAIAWDVGIFENGTYYEGKNKKENDAYDALAATIDDTVSGIEWGGAWTSFPDPPHYQCVTGKSTAQIRGLLEAGKSYL